jgi:hypothetical protein
MMRDVEDDRFALLEPAPCQVEIELSQTEASITNGKIKAVVTEYGWHASARIQFFNQKGELLLSETGNGGAESFTAQVPAHPERRLPLDCHLRRQ